VGTASLKYHEWLISFESGRGQTAETEWKIPVRTTSSSNLAGEHDQLQDVKSERAAAELPP
jgi:hypothetical protein